MPTPKFVQAIRQWTLNFISFALRLALWYGTLLFVTLTLFSIIVFAVAKIQLENSVDQSLQSRAQLIAQTIQGTLLTAQDTTSTATPTVSHTPTSQPAPTSTQSSGSPVPTTTPFATPVPTVD